MLSFLPRLTAAKLVLVAGGVLAGGRSPVEVQWQASAYLTDAPRLCPIPQVKPEPVVLTMPRLDHPGRRLDAWSPVELSPLPPGTEPRLTPQQAWNIARLVPSGLDLAGERLHFGVGYVPGNWMLFDSGGFQGLGGPPGHIVWVALATAPETAFCEHGTATDYLIIDDATGTVLGSAGEFAGS